MGFRGDDLHRIRNGKSGQDAARLCDAEKRRARGPAGSSDDPPRTINPSFPGSRVSFAAAASGAGAAADGGPSGCPANLPADANEHITPS